MSKTPVTRRGAFNMIDEARDASRTMADWMKFDLNTLRLKCNGYNVCSKGNKKALCRALVKKFGDRGQPNDQEPTGAE